MGILKYVAGLLYSNDKKVMTEDNVLGVGQTWQDVKASRSYSTVYTNTTGKPICLSTYAYITSVGNVGHMAVYVSGVEVARVYVYAGETLGKTLSVEGIIIPNGATYEVRDVSTTLTTVVWSELR